MNSYDLRNHILGFGNGYGVYLFSLRKEHLQTTHKNKSFISYTAVRLFMHNSLVQAEPNLTFSVNAF